MTSTVVRTTPVDAAPLPRDTQATRVMASEIAFLLALVLGWGLAYLLVLSPFQAGHAQSQLYNELRATLAEGTAPTGSPIAEGTAVALLDIPAAGVSDLVVQEGATSALLRNGPGHVRGTRLPGQVGVSTVMGRSLSFGAPFRRIADLRSTDTITVRTMQGKFTYRVSEVRRGGAALPAVTAGSSRLVLVTSAGDGPLGRSEVVYVDAVLAGTPAPAGPVGDGEVADAAMAQDASALTWAELALALLCVIGALAWVVWTRLRWSVLAAWSTGLPVLLATLWLASSVASRLLPNLV